MIHAKAIGCNIALSEVGARVDGRRCVGCNVLAAGNMREVRGPGIRSLRMGTIRGCMRRSRCWWGRRPATIRRWLAGFETTAMDHSVNAGRIRRVTAHRDRTWSGDKTVGPPGAVLGRGTLTVISCHRTQRKCLQFRPLYVTG
jgi:hypothetical protein